MDGIGWGHNAIFSDEAHWICSFSNSKMKLREKKIDVGLELRHQDISSEFEVQLNVWCWRVGLLAQRTKYWTIMW